MNKFLENRKGITLIVLVITIIVLIILAGVTIATLTGENGILTQAEKAVVLSEVGEIKDKIKLNTMNEDGIEKITGKLSEISVDIDSNLIDKYNDILYVKNSELYLDFIANFPNMESYINNKKKIEILKDSMEICYDRIKTYNKLLNSSFDDGLNNYTTRMTPGNVTEIVNEDGNNYLHMEMYVSSGNTQWVWSGNPNIASKYGEKCYVSIKYRNSYVQSEEGFVLNNDIITLSRYARGFDQILLNKTNFINSYNSGWVRLSTIRKIESNTSNLGLNFSLGGGPANGQTQEYSVDFDDLYMINLTELFGEGNEPTKEEMDAIFNNF